MRSSLAKVSSAFARLGGKPNPSLPFRRFPWRGSSRLADRRASGRSRSDHQTARGFDSPTIVVLQRNRRLAAAPQPRRERAGAVALDGEFLLLYITIIAESTDRGWEPGWRTPTTARRRREPRAAHDRAARRRPRRRPRSAGQAQRDQRRNDRGAGGLFLEHPAGRARRGDPWPRPEFLGRARPERNIGARRDRRASFIRAPGIAASRKSNSAPFPSSPSSKAR